MKSTHFTFQGLRDRTKQIGYGRHINLKTNTVREGHFENLKQNSFGRIIFPLGMSYIGGFADN